MSIKPEPPTMIKLQHDWYHKIYPFRSNNSASENVYSNFFDSNTLPNVRFQIFGVATFNNTYTVIITKTPCTLLNAAIQILALGNIERRFITIPKWNDTCKLEFVIVKDYHQVNTLFTCKITWNGFEESQPVGLNKHMGNSLATSDFSDIMIKIDDHEIPVHKIILAARSPVFSTIFKTNMTEATNGIIIVEDIDVDIMKMAIEFMYTDGITSILNIDIVLSILEVANKYEIADLKMFCERKLFERISNNNIMKILEAASSFNVPQLIESITSYMVENKRSIIQLKAFKDLLLEKPELFFEFIVRSFAMFPIH